MVRLGRRKQPTVWEEKKAREGGKPAKYNQSFINCPSYLAGGAEKKVVSC